MPARPLTTSRRTALAVTAGVTGWALGGCTADSPGSPTAAVSTSAPPVDADQTLATDVALRLAAIGAYADRLAEDLPALRRTVRPFRRLHAAHLEALGGLDESVPSPAPVTAEPAAALRAFRREEQGLQRELVRAAVLAESGTLAKLLASMSAAVAQHLAVL